VPVSMEISCILNMLMGYYIDEEKYDENFMEV
jgi:hypothetical protein